MTNADFPNKDDLEAELDRAVVVEPEKMPSNVATMNSTVKFRVASTDKEFLLTLVYPNAKASFTCRVIQD